MEVKQREYQPLENHWIPGFTGPVTATKPRLALTVTDLICLREECLSPLSLTFFLLQRIPPRQSSHVLWQWKVTNGKGITVKLARQSTMPSKLLQLLLRETCIQALHWKKAQVNLDHRDPEQSRRFYRQVQVRNSYWKLSWIKTNQRLNMKWCSDARSEDKQN